MLPLANGEFDKENGVEQASTTPDEAKKENDGALKEFDQHYNLKFKRKKIKKSNQVSGKEFDKDENNRDLKEFDEAVMGSQFPHMVDKRGHFSCLTTHLQQMETLPEALLLEILSRLHNSADATRLRLSSKTFNSLYPHLKSINLQCTLSWYLKTRPNSSQNITPFKTVFMNMISDLNVVESVRIGIEKAVKDAPYDLEVVADDLHLTDGCFVIKWLPRVCGKLKLLSISDFWAQSFRRPSNVLQLVSHYCHNLVELEVKNAWLSAYKLIPMHMLTSLTLESVRLYDEDLNKLNMYTPNLQALNLISVRGLELEYPKIHHLNLKTCYLKAPISGTFKLYTITTPNLITLRLECLKRTGFHVEAPILSHIHVALDNTINCPQVFELLKVENLKKVWLTCDDIRELLYKFQLNETVETLTLDSPYFRKYFGKNFPYFTLYQVFAVFPRVNSLCIKSNAWLTLEAFSNSLCGEVQDGKNGLNTLTAYLLLVDPSLTFSCVSFVLHQCLSLSEVSFFVHSDVVAKVSKSFISKCVAHWPGLKWRWGIWSKKMEDSWITDY